MITDEEIKNLKPGDPLIVHGKFKRIYDDGDLGIEVDVTDAFSDDVIKDIQYAHPSCVSLPSVKPIEMFHITKIPETYPKYDPCRLFRKGDKVRVVEKDGRTVHDPLNGGLWEVSRNERSGGACETSVLVHLFYEDEKIAWQISVPFCFLELVTPVEELEPYRVVRPENYQCIRIMKEKRIHSSIPFDEEECVCRTLEEAKAAAEAECARLNAEYRKEQK